MATCRVRSSIERLMGIENSKGNRSEARKSTTTMKASRLYLPVILQTVSFTRLYNFLLFSIYYSGCDYSEYRSKSKNTCRKLLVEIHFIRGSAHKNVSVHRHFLLRFVFNILILLKFSYVITFEKCLEEFRFVPKIPPSRAPSSPYLLHTLDTIGGQYLFDPVQNDLIQYFRQFFQGIQAFFWIIK